MTPYEMEEQLRNLDERTRALEQKLPLAATKDDLRELRQATKHDLDELRQATKDDLGELRQATKDDLRELRQELCATLATKEDLKAYATKDDLDLTTKALQREIAGCATKDELKTGLEDGRRYTLLLFRATRGEIRQLGQQLGQQVGSLANDVRGIAEQLAIMSTQLTHANRKVPAVKARKRKK